MIQYVKCAVVAHAVIKKKKPKTSHRLESIPSNLTQWKNYKEKMC